MNQRSSLPPASKLTVAALLVAAAGFVLQIVSGVDVPTVPPGLVIMLVVAGLVAFLPWRWIPAVGAAVGLFLLVGIFARGAVGSLLEPSRLGVFIGAWVQFLAVIVAVGAWIVAVVQNYHSRTAIGAEGHTSHEGRGARYTRMDHPPDWSSVCDTRRGRFGRRRYGFWQSHE